MEKEVRLTIDIPSVNATEDEIAEFITFSLGLRASISLNNPLCGEELGFIKCDILKTDIRRAIK